MSPFCWATDSLFWTSGDVSSGFQSQSGFCLIQAQQRCTCCYVTHSLRFTSGVTPADLLAASITVKLSLPHTCKTLVGLETRSYHAAAHSVRSGRPDSLLTELSRLGLYYHLFLFLFLLDFDLFLLKGYQIIEKIIPFPNDHFRFGDY